MSGSRALDNLFDDSDHGIVKARCCRRDVQVKTSLMSVVFVDDWSDPSQRGTRMFARGEKRFKRRALH
jgi:hypothetical protein